MINLLQSLPSKATLAQFFREQPPVPLLPPLGDNRWTAAFCNPPLDRILASLVERARTEIDQPLPELTDALYRDFANTGVRLRFENVYFERRRQPNA